MKDYEDNISIPDFAPDQLYFIPLGGSEEFGVNLNVYGYEGKWLVVDCGMGFADERYPGIDLLLPDPTFIEDRRHDVVALVITHAHEDHIGAVSRLWPRLRCPIYASPFTAAILKHKLAENQECRDAEIFEVEAGDITRLAPFSVEWVPVAHSVPDTCALIIETAAGRVVHSGDWNLDPTPVLGQTTNPEPFKRAGEKGVLAYIGDSTNAEIAGRAASEKDVETGLRAVFKGCKKRIAVTVFASNIGRIASICRAAHACDRQVALVGRSLYKMTGAARDCGFLTGIDQFVSEEQAGYFPEDKIVYIVTGSQGEARAALARIARGDHDVLLSRGDTVVFSARPIPGNEKEINTVKNNLSAAGIDVITPHDTDQVIHVSGHPYQDEIVQMYQWTKPQMVIPVHGERAMLEAQARLARESQVKTVIVPVNGAVIALGPKKQQVVGRVPTGLLAVEPNRVVRGDHMGIAERRKLQFSGALHVSVVLDRNGELLADPRLDTLGLLDPSEEKDMKLEDKLHDEIEAVLDDMTWEERQDDQFVQEQLRIGLRRLVNFALGIKPKATIHVLRV